MKTHRQVQWRPSCSRACSSPRDVKTSNDMIDGCVVAIEKHVGDTPLVPSSLFKIIEHHLHNHYRCCT